MESTKGGDYTYKEIQEEKKLGGNMDRKQIYIDVLLQKGIYKEEKTGRQLYEMTEQELWNLIKGVYQE